MFLRKTKAREPLPLTMIGVRMGERLLQVGLDDPALSGALASKIGLSGTIAIAVANEEDAARATAAASKAGALVDVTKTALESLPYPDASFDVIVLHALRAPIGGPAPGVSSQALLQCLRVLRPGGRIVVLTPGPKTGFGALLRPAPPAAADTAAAATALTAAGFRPVRVVGELEGLRFTEGLKA